MRALTIRGIPGDHLRWLRARAARGGRSLNSELLDLIAIARTDELAQQHAQSAFARSWLLARRLGVRTASDSRRVVRADRDRDHRP